jgi:ATP-dependent RNA helicase RhlB
VAEAPQGDKPARKRRRRRNGRPVEGGEAVQGAAAPADGEAALKASRTGDTPPPKARPAEAPVAGHPNDSFLTRLGRKIKSLVGG